MSTVLLSRAARAAFIVDQWIRNGFIPKAALQNLLAERAGQAASIRAKQVFRSPGNIGAIPSSAGAGPRYRWSFAWHSGPYGRTVAVYMLLAKQDDSGSSDAYGALQVYSIDACDPDVDDPVAIARFRYGNAGGLATTDAPSEWGDGLALLVNPANEDNELVTLSPDTEYVAYFADYNDARIISACVLELALEPNTGNGYTQVTTAANAPILDADRATPLTMARQIWKRCGTPVFHWCADTEADAATQTSGEASGALAESVGNVTVAGTGTTQGGLLSESIGDVTLTAEGGTASLECVLSSDAGAGTWPTDTLLPFHLDITTAGPTQNNGTIRVLVYDNYGTNVISGMSAGSLDGWSQTGWSLAGGIWSNTYTRASVPAGSYRIDFYAILGLNTGHVYVALPGGADVPRTDEAQDASTNSLDVHLRYPP